MRAALLAPALALLAACTTVDSNSRNRNGRSAVFSNSRSERIAATYGTQAYEDTLPAPSGWESPSATTSSSRRPSSGSGRASSRTAATHEASRLASLEAELARLQSQVDSMSASQESVVAQANATVSRSSSSFESMRSDIETLRAEVASLKAENQTLRAELNSQRSQIEALPGKITSAVSSAISKSSGSSSGGGRSSSSRRSSGEFYEHTVASGDTVSDIAKAYGVTTAAIVRENNLKDAGAIRVGQKLYIPAK